MHYNISHQNKRDIGKTYLTNVDVVIIKTVLWKSSKTVLTSTTTIINTAQLSVTA